MQELAGLSRLEWLNLGYTQVTDAAMKDLAKLDTLKTLFLDRTHVTDISLQDLVKLNKLQMFSLRAYPNNHRNGIMKLSVS